ncbi:MAG: hypothetical protein U0T74_07290 [Chitinophagales bacterium]
MPVFHRRSAYVVSQQCSGSRCSVIQVSMPDTHGFCSLGVSVDVTKAATDVAKTIIALVNPNMPRSLGDGLIHHSRFSAAVYAEDISMNVRLAN